MNKILVLSGVLVVPLSAYFYLSTINTQLPFKEHEIALNNQIDPASATLQTNDHQPSSDLEAAKKIGIEKNRLNYSSQDLISRFMTESDEKQTQIEGIPVRASWATRPSEYAWAMKFTNSDLVVLDAGCGVSHPFKWYLAANSKKTWGVDASPHIENKESVLHETLQDLGSEAHEVISSRPELWDNLHLCYQSMMNLPADAPTFDRIFCIGVLDNLTQEEHKNTFKEFARVLAPNGLVLLTFPGTSINPEQLIEDARDKGLVPAGPVNFEFPSAENNEIGLTPQIFRLVLKHGTAPTSADKKMSKKEEGVSKKQNMSLNRKRELIALEIPTNENLTNHSETKKVKTSENSDEKIKR